MNIGEKFICSRCLRYLEDEMICPFCGYNPESPVEQTILEEGTLLHNGRFQIGAVNKVDSEMVVYGAFDHARSKPVFIGVNRKKVFIVGYPENDEERL